MTSFDFDVIGDRPQKPLPNVQKPPAEKAPPVAPIAPPEQSTERRDRAA